MHYESNPNQGGRNKREVSVHPVARQVNGNSWPGELGTDLVTYKRVLSERFATPLLKLEEQAIEKFEQDIGYAYMQQSIGYFQNAADKMAER